MVARRCPIVTNWAGRRNCTRRSCPDGRRQALAAESRGESTARLRPSDLLLSGCPSTGPIPRVPQLYGQVVDDWRTLSIVSCWSANRKLSLHTGGATGALVGL